jgi:hypothetical protein
LGNASKFFTDADEDDRIYKTADGNICTTYGGSFSFSSYSKKIKASLLFQKRNFLSPEEVRLLSPNPFVLLENARLVCSANNIISSVSLKLNSAEIKLNTVYEYDILKTQLIQNEISLAKEDARKNNYRMGFGFNKQIAGLNYYWYPQNKMWMQAACKISKQEAQISFSLFLDKGKIIQSGISLQKYF